MTVLEPVQDGVSEWFDGALLSLLVQRNKVTKAPHKPAFGCTARQNHASGRPAFKLKGGTSMTAARQSLSRPVGSDRNIIPVLFGC